uniref:Uncharacterized protein n=1 Tax=Tanacetum cinerariifolium TaxID=118510 RepID=A0A6L2KRF6_TANCI|nr:hypothetical protein [Tanacetum cinerariifolium]
MGKPLSPDSVFAFPADELEPHPAYNFFATDSYQDVIAEPVDEAEGQVITLVVGKDEDIAMLFVDDDFKDDDVTPTMQPSSIYEVRGPCTVAAEGLSFPLPTLGLPIPPSVIEDFSTRLSNPEYRHGQLVKKVIQVSDAELAAGVSIREIGPRVIAIEGQVQVMTSQMVHATER